MVTSGEKELVQVTSTRESVYMLAMQVTSEVIIVNSS